MEKLKEKIKSLARKKNKISINFIPWNDYQYFEELCNEDGGIIDKHLKIYKNFNDVKKMEGVDQLIAEIEKCNAFPYLHSKAGNERFFYDLHIWINDYYIIYNSYYEKVRAKKMGILERLFNPVEIPDWSNIE